MQQIFYFKLLRIKIYFIIIATMLFSVSLMVNSAYASKNSVTIGMILEPPHLDPTAGASAAIDEIVYNNIFEGLTRIDKNGEVQPLLATHWDISSDELTYKFYLKKNVKFHNGKIFGSDDVVFSIMRAKDEKTTNPRKEQFTNIESVKAFDSTTVVMKLKNRRALFLYEMGSGNAIIVEESSANTNKNHPIGTGPFIFDKMKKGYWVKLKSNKNYSGKISKIKKVKFRFLPDNSSATSALLSGDVDAFPLYNDMISLPIFKNNPRFNVIIGSTEGETLVAINNSNSKFKDIRVRRALNHAIDKLGVIAVSAEGAEPIGSHFPPQNPAYIDLSNAYPYDVAKAKDLLKQAGAENLELTFMVPPSYGLSSEVIADYLRKVGIKVTLKSVDWGTWIAIAYKKHEYDITIVSHVEPRDYGIYAKPNYYFGYHNPNYNKLLEKLNLTIDTLSRRKILQDIQRMLSKDAVNVWLYQMTKVGIWNKKLKGMWHNSPIPGIVLRDVYWQD